MDPFKIFFLRYYIRHTYCNTLLYLERPFVRGHYSHSILLDHIGELICMELNTPYEHNNFWKYNILIH